MYLLMISHKTNCISDGSARFAALPDDVTYSDWP